MRLRFATIKGAWALKHDWDFRQEVLKHIPPRAFGYDGADWPKIRILYPDDEARP